MNRIGMVLSGVSLDYPSNYSLPISFFSNPHRLGGVCEPDRHGLFTPIWLIPILPYSH
jgi:hypothetical protein